MSIRDSERNKTTGNSAATYRTVLIFGIFIAAIMLVSQIEPIRAAVSSIIDMLMPVFIGVVLAYVINPFTVVFERWMYNIFKLKHENSRRSFARGLAITFSVILLVAAIALLIFLIIPEFLVSLDKLIDSTTPLIEKGIDWVNGAQLSDNIFIQNIGQYIDSMFTTLVEWLTSGLGTAVSAFVNSVISVVNFLFDFLIAIVVFIYALLEKHKFVAQSKKLLFAVCKSERANDILDIARYGNDVFGKFVSGKLITSTIVGVVTFSFMSIMGMPYALLSAGVIAITNIIPFFGPFIGGIPTAFFVLITDVRQGVIYIIFLVVLQQLEGNIIEPMIMEDKTGLSKFWVTFALLLCGGVFGIAGMIFSVPLFAVLFYTIKIYVERSLEKKNLPISSSAYANAGGLNTSTNELYPAPHKTPHKKLRQAIKEWRARVKHKDDDDSDDVEEIVE